MHNGTVTTCVRLACALQYFAGRSPYNIMAKYRVSHASMMDSVWVVVEAVNLLDEIIIEYLSSEEEQLNIALEFKKVN